MRARKRVACKVVIAIAVGPPWLLDRGLFVGRARFHGWVGWALVMELDLDALFSQDSREGAVIGPMMGDRPPGNLVLLTSQ